MLTLNNVEAGYDDKSIITNISFSIQPREFTAILGLNGTGKTTLLKTISGLLKPSAGKIFLNNEDMLLLNEKDLAKKISFMPQRHSIIYDIKVIDLVLMGITPYLSLFESPSKKHKEQAYKILEDMKLEAFSEKNFLHLSEGEKQLIIMARSLLQDSKIMLFDEPVSALDFKNKHFVLNNIKNILEKENKVGIITLHDPNLALSYCDRIIIIDQKNIYADFLTQNIDVKFLSKIFKSLYGEVSIVKHKEKFVIVR